MLDDDKRLLEELQEKLKEVELKVEELEEASGGEETPEDDVGYFQVSSGSNQFFLHWVDISETGFESCDDIDSVEKAQTAFKEASEHREDQANDKREIMHGDLIVLLCNTAKEVDEETEEVTYNDSCYYVGMCVATDGVMQEENPVTDIKIASSTLDDSETVKQFISWNSCGGETCPEEPETIELDELIFPESSGSGSEEITNGLEVTSSASGEQELAKIDQVKQFTFEPKEDESSDDETPTVYGLIQNPEPARNSGTLVGHTFNLSEEFLYKNSAYDYKATEVDRVTLSKNDVVTKKTQYSTKNIELHKQTISSDSCGELKKVAAKDDSEEPIIETKSLLFSDNTESSEEFTFSALTAVEGSAEVSIGNVFNFDSLKKTDELIEGSKVFFAPILENRAKADDIKATQEVEYISDMKIVVSETAIEDAPGCKTITIKPQFKKTKLTFNSGLMTGVTEPESDAWVDGTAGTVNVCEGDNAGTYHTLQVCTESGEEQDLRIKVYPPPEEP